VSYYMRNLTIDGRVFVTLTRRGAVG
jgi:hypothetical protein